MRKNKQEKRLLVVMYDDGTMIVKADHKTDVRVDVIDYNKGVAHRNIKVRSNDDNFKDTDWSLTDECNVDHSSDFKVR